ncbi:MAG: FxLYD domain-containing protein [Candidatus Adiutrix sp.]|jgi:hypothetical protein|nr:FxLYD domain-containing protein [Candidatus Adiutrix sp.]
MKSKIFLLLVLALFACGCARTIAGEKRAPIDSDVSEMAPGGLEIMVMDFSWTYFNEGVHMRIAGTVRNNTGQPQQAVMLSAVLYDERGTPSAQGTSYVTPTYLPVGAQGRFEIVAMPARNDIKHARLVYSCRTSSSYY